MNPNQPPRSLEKNRSPESAEVANYLLNHPDFQDFSQLVNAIGVDLESGVDRIDLFYDQFIRKDFSQPELSVSQLDAINQNLEKTKIDLIANRLPNTNIISREKWLGVNLNKAELEDIKYRVYLNPQPETMSQTFKSLVERARVSGIEGQIKIRQQLNESNYSKSDKIVAYFETDQQLMNFLEEVDQLQNQQPENWREEAPRFAQRIPVNPEQNMPGVAVAAEVDKHLSFGQIMSRILYFMHEASPHGQFSLASPAVQRAYISGCRTYGLNPLQIQSRAG